MSDTHRASRNEVTMAAKDKKRKRGKSTATASVGSPAGQAKAVATTEAKEAKAAPPAVEAKTASSAAVARPAAVTAKKEAPKPKAAKASPVLSKKPSKFRFFVDAYLELRKAHWLGWREATRLSLLVAALCVAVGVALGMLDFGFSWLMRLLLFRS